MWITTLATTSNDAGAAWAWRCVGPDGAVTTGDGVEPGATGPRAELLGALAALDAAGRPCRLDGPTALATLATRWLPGWKAAGWRKSDGKPVANVDLVRRLADVTVGVTWSAVDADPALRARARARLDAMPAATVAAVGVAGVAPTGARVLVYTDGGCRGNPGIGGWGAILVDPAGAKARVLVGGERETTNNRMEMSAALQALSSLKGDGVVVEVRTDSRYLIDVASKWMPSWKRGGWKRKDGEPVKNLDLVQALDAAITRHRVRWTWVEGHAGEPGNEFVDRLTNEAMDAITAGRSPARDETLTPSPLRPNKGP